MKDTFNLKYLTSGDAKASLKRKVFCAYHPNDSRLLNEVFQDLSKTCGCTMFYYESGKEPDNKEQLETDLKSMNLFVLIVTHDFLFRPCFANKVALDFAVKHAIPVLPILFESGLEESFNEKIGNLQCLSKFQEKIDATAVPYNEKLSNYLSQVLSADADMKRCYSAFDASIFLSYRKKDRKYAQRLMELIHEDEICRNIAIWYDEFLVPGEDFNDSIKTELEESAMFVLVVTPHIVEGDNYITLTEYPMATSLNKTVLPFEMERTSGRKLKRFCPGIEKPFHTMHGAHVRKVILDAFNKLGVVQGENTAERTFLIGLAYLKGICVEKNSEIGFSMVLQAAESNVQEAIKILVLLYRNGEGTKQDLAAAVMWQKRLLSIYKNSYEADACEENAHTVVKAYFVLAEIQTQSKHYNAAHDTYKKIVAFCENETIKDSIYAKRYAAMAYELSGKLCMLEGNYAEANIINFEEAMKIREQLQTLEPTVQSKLELIEVHTLIGEYLEQLNNTVGVKSKAVDIKRLIAQVKEIEATAENYNLIKRLMLCNNRLGHLYNVVNMWDTADVYIGKAILLAEKLVEISNTTEAKRQLMLAYMNDGDHHVSCSVENRYKAAYEAYQKAYQIAKQLLSERESLEIQLDMATIIEKQGHVLSVIESNEVAIKYYEKALAYFRSARELADTLPIKRKLYRCCFAAANVYDNSGNKDKALTMLKESEKISVEVIHISPAAALQAEYAETLAALGEFYKSQWEIDEALAYYQKNHDILKEVWLRSRRLRELMLYMNSFKKYIATAKLAGDFELADELEAELKGLYEDNSYMLKHILFNSVHIN